MAFRTLARLAAIALMAVSTASVLAAPPPKNVEVCPAHGDGTGASGGTPKIDVNGDENAVYVSAPSGYLISGYCVKAGTETFHVTVDPPQASIQLTAPNGKDVSHYSLIFVQIPEGGDGQWCSPGFWRANAVNRDAAAWPVSTDTLYNDVISDPTVAGNPTLLEVLLSPKTYGGAAFNAVATYLSIEAGLNVTDPIVHDCPLSNAND